MGFCSSAGADGCLAVQPSSICVGSVHCSSDSVILIAPSLSLENKRKKKKEREGEEIQSLTHTKSSEMMCLISCEGGGCALIVPTETGAAVKVYGSGR